MGCTMPHKNGFGKKGIKNLHMTQWVYYRKHNEKESNAMLSECEVGGGGEYIVATDVQGMN